MVVFNWLIKTQLARKLMYGNLRGTYLVTMVTARNIVIHARSHSPTRTKNNVNKDLKKKVKTSKFRYEADCL